MHRDREHEVRDGTAREEGRVGRLRREGLYGVHARGARRGRKGAPRGGTEECWSGQGGPTEQAKQRAKCEGRWHRNERQGGGRETVVKHAAACKAD